MSRQLNRLSGDSGRKKCRDPNLSDLLAVPGAVVSILALYKGLKVLIRRRRHKTSH